MKIDELALIKTALEYAQFKDWRVREGVNNLLKELDADLNDVAFQSSVETKKIADEFQASLTELETKLELEKPDSDDLDDDLEIEVRPKKEEDDDDDELVVENDDDDDDDDDDLTFDDEEELEEDKTQQT